MYDIGIQNHNNLVTIKMTGFWSIGTVKDFAHDMRIAVASLDCMPGDHLVLVDLSQFKVQAQAVIAAFQAFILSADPAARRIAFVRGEGLAHIQSKRVMVRDPMAMFDTRIDAMDWLLCRPTPIGVMMKVPELRAQPVL
jgi:hypothetical protein